jgi:hypothetical protein
LVAAAGLVSLDCSCWGDRCAGHPLVRRTRKIREKRAKFKPAKPRSENRPSISIINSPAASR